MIAHAPILSQRQQVEHPAFLLRDRALADDRRARSGPMETPSAVTSPGQCRHSSMIGISVKPESPLPWRLGLSASDAVPAATAFSCSIRFRNDASACVPIPNVAYILRNTSYGGRSPCSSSSRIGITSLAMKSFIAGADHVMLFGPLVHGHESRVRTWPAPSLGGRGSRRRCSQGVVRAIPNRTAARSDMQRDQRFTRPSSIAATITVAALLAGACGGDSVSRASAVPTTTSSTTSSSTSSTTTAPEATTSVATTAEPTTTEAASTTIASTTTTPATTTPASHDSAPPRFRPPRRRPHRRRRQRPLRPPRLPRRQVRRPIRP